MGQAIPIIGAGASLISGVSSANTARRQAAAQTQINQAEYNAQYLQSALNLEQLKAQQQRDQLTDTIQTSLQAQQLSSTKAALDAQTLMAQMEQSTALNSLEMQKTATDSSAAVSKSAIDIQALSAEIAALQGQSSQTQKAASGAVESIVSQLNSLPKTEQASQIQSLLQVASAGGTSNPVLKALANRVFESDNQIVGEVSRDAQFFDTTADSAESQARTQTAQARAQADQAATEVDIDAADTTGNIDLAKQDLSYSSKLGQSARDLQKRSADRAFSMDAATTNTERAARDAAIDNAITAGKANMQYNSDVLSARNSSISSPGFLSYLTAGINAANTYQSLGGSTSFLSRARRSSTIKQGNDFPNISSSIG